MTDGSDAGLPEDLQTVELTTSPAMARAYAELTADFNPIHLDPAFAADTPFSRPIAHGTMALNLILVAAARTFGRTRRPSDLAVRFVKPVPVGATIRAAGRLADPAHGLYEVFVETDEGVRAIEGTLTVDPAA